jgi:hypothetical protein
MSSGKLEHAFLDFAEPGEKGEKGAPMKRIEFMFNPKEIAVTKTVSWDVKPSTTKSLPQYLGTKPQAISVEMFLDASEGGDVTSKVDDLLKSMEPTPKTEDEDPSPPYCSFGWGKKTYLSAAVIKTVAVKYTRFKPDGTPIRAVANVTLEELRAEPAKTNPTSGSPNAEAERIVLPGDSLASIAYEELGKPTLWRAIAEANGVDDPFRLRPGTSLIIPGRTALESGSQN